MESSADNEGGTPAKDYYASRLSAERLRRCYDLAPPRVRRYLHAEVEFVREQLRPSDVVLELGCGYGRVAVELARTAARVVGIDTAPESLKLARELAGPSSVCEFVQMDASTLAFGDGEFDSVVCVQNGICAFGVEPVHLVGEALRVARPGGAVLVSTYAEAFWPSRLEWFEAQAEEGLIGKLDREATGNGTIVCTDGLRLEMMSPQQLSALGSALGIAPEITEVDGSSVFATWRVPE